MFMNKTQLIAAIAEKASISKKQAADFFNAFTQVTEEALKANESVTLPGFGSFGVKETKERTMRNPANGEKITVKAGKKPYFKFSKSVSDSFKG